MKLTSRKVDRDGKEEEWEASRFVNLLVSEIFGCFLSALQRTKHPNKLEHYFRNPNLNGVSSVKQISRTF